MSLAERANTLRRHELRRVFGLLDEGRSWSMHPASIYIAHAVFQYGGFVGHVVGNTDGWWWALQDRPRQLGPMIKAGGPREACLLARRAARSAANKGRTARP